MQFNTITPLEILGGLNKLEAKYAPSTLYYLGDISIFQQGARVSIVGARDSDDDALKRAERLARILVSKHDVVIVSGLAKGIDTAAHRSAIKEGGRTIAVIGTGLDRSYPPGNEELQDQIASEHLLVSQYKPGTPPSRKNFPLRNRVMALLSDATVIIHAGESSGTESQAWEALRIGRPLYLAKSMVDAVGAEWMTDVLRYGAHILSEDTLPDLIEELPPRNGSIVNDLFAMPA